MLSRTLAVVGGLGMLLACGGSDGEETTGAANQAHHESQSFCDKYASLTLRQQQDNERYRCGLTGEEWEGGLADHVEYCKRLDPDVPTQRLRSREEALRACKDGGSAPGAPKRCLFGNVWCS